MNLTKFISLFAFIVTLFCGVKVFAMCSAHPQYNNGEYTNCLVEHFRVEGHKVITYKKERMNITELRCQNYCTSKPVNEYDIIDLGGITYGYDPGNPQP